MRMPADRQTFFLPPPDGTFATFQVGGNLFPGIQAFARHRLPRLWKSLWFVYARKSRLIK